MEIGIGAKKVRIGAIAKGAGMMQPKMEIYPPRHATMLCFVTTDARIGVPALRQALRQAVDRTFNTITVDGDTSTNDMVLVLANGEAGNREIVEGSKDFASFSRALESIFLGLSKRMILDAEGATKFVEVQVKNAATREDAGRVSKAVANSVLVKCALFGCDPNWGRIAAAAGYSGANVDPWKMTISLGGEPVLRNGGGVVRDTAALNRIFAKKSIKITIDLGLGRYGATAYTCDLSFNYVRINSAYRT